MAVHTGPPREFRVMGYDVIGCIYVVVVILAASAGSVGVYIVIGLAKSKMGLLQATARCEVQRRA